MPINWSLQVLNMCILGMWQQYQDINAISKLYNILDKDMQSYNIHLHKSKLLKLKEQKSYMAFGNTYYSFKSSAVGKI